MALHTESSLMRIAAPLATLDIELKRVECYASSCKLTVSRYDLGDIEIVARVNQLLIAGYRSRWYGDDNTVEIALIYDRRDRDPEIFDKLLDQALNEFRINE